MIDLTAIVAAWERNRASGKRRFHDEHPETIALGQKLFATWAESAVGHIPWFEIAPIKLPADYLHFVEVVQIARPKVLIETGSNSGGSAAVWAEIFRRVVGAEFRIITIELKAESLDRRWIDSDPNIVSLVGDCTSAEILEQVRALIPEGCPTMVTLDSAHDGRHVCKEIGLYGNLVSPGQYLIVEDSFLGLYWGGNLQAHECREAIAHNDVRRFDYHDCPLGAVEALLDASNDFAIDLDRQRYQLTLNPFGFLKKK